MDYSKFSNLVEAYHAVYDKNLQDELEEMSDEFSGIEYLSDEDIDVIVEETIEEMLDEGYNFDEVEEIFEEFILEMNPYAPAGSKASKEYAKKTSQAKRQKERGEKISQVTGAVKSALGRVKRKVERGVEKAKEAGREVKFQTVDRRVRDYANKRNLHPAAGAAARSKDPAKRRALRGKVASDIMGRISGKISRAVDRAKTAGAGVASAAMSAPSAAKSAVKSGIVKGASAVSRRARNVARRMSEEVDIYDVVLEHLVVEGYADTLEQAEAIMVNMSEEWREEILDEAYVDWRKGKLPSGRTPQQAAQGRTNLLNARAKVDSLKKYDSDPYGSKWQRRYNQSERTKQMDSHTGLRAKAGKQLWARNMGNEPNTQRHSAARRKRKMVSDLKSAEKESRG